MNRNGLRYVPGLLVAGLVAAAALTTGGCSAVATLAAAAQGCDEFPGSVSTLQLGGDAQAFVQAGADVVALAKCMECEVLTA